jgi:hypothetical protein
MRFFSLTTSLSEPEVMQRLRDCVDTKWLGGSSAIRGNIGTRSFSLRCRIAYRNSFQTNLRGRLVNEGTSTRIRCYAGMHPFVIAFMIFWFAVVSVGTTAVLQELAEGEVSPFGLLIGLGLPVFGVVLVAVGRYFARTESETLIAFLEETLDAQRA